MINGKLRLATWGADVLRMYELHESGPIQLWTAPMAQGSNPQSDGVLPSLWFAREDSLLLAWKQGNSSPFNTLELYDSLGDVVPSGVIYNHPTTVYKVRGAYNHKKETLTALTFDSGSFFSNAALVKSDNTLAGQTGNSARLPTYTTMNYVVVDKEARCLVKAGQTDAHFYLAVADTAEGAAQFEDTGSVLTGAAGTVDGCWSPDGNYFMCIHETEGLKLFTFDGTSFTLRDGGGIDLVGIPHKIRCSADGRTVAISFDMTGSFQTVLYKRVGYQLSPLTTLSGDFGELLDFTSDGAFLLDANSRRIFEFNQSTKQWEERINYLNSLPAGIQSQALGTRPSEVSGKAYPYNLVSGKIANKALQDNDLRMILLNDQASFNPEHTTYAEVTGNGSYLVENLPGWPGNGKDISAVSIVPDGLGRVIYKAVSPVKHLVTGQELVYRYVVIYHVADMEPIAFIDPLETVTIAVGYEASWRYDLSGILSLAV